MPRTIFTGVGKAFWVADPTGAGTVVTLAAPTAVQVNTGVNITPFMRRDGLSRPQSGNLVDTSDASSKFNSTDLGTFGGDKITLKLYRDSLVASDTAWPLFLNGKRGFLIVFPFGLAGATPAAGDRCEVYQVAVNTRPMNDIADNTPNLFSPDLAVVSPPNMDAALA